MASKRPRPSEELAASGQGYSAWENGIACFGQHLIHEIESHGNANFARGAFGEISIALGKGTDSGEWRFVAIKNLENAVVVPGGMSFGRPPEAPKLGRDVFNELCALKHLSGHANIVPIRAWYQSRSRHLSQRCLSLVFDYSPTDLHISLEWRRRLCKSPLKMPVIKTIAHDILSAVAHCHKLGVLHRDIKPGNFLVSSSGVIQMCDFGLAKPFLDEDNLPTKPVKGGSGTKGLCTLIYRPPEVLLGGSATATPIDTYSAGLVLIELVVGRPLLNGSNDMEQLSLIFEALGTPSDNLWPAARDLPDYGKFPFATRESAPTILDMAPRLLEHDALGDLLSRLLALDPSCRLAAADGLDHLWFGQSTMASRKEVCHWLIPPGLETPALLDPNHTIVAEKLAIRISKRRRTFFSSIDTRWDHQACDESPLDLLHRWRD